MHRAFQVASVVKNPPTDARDIEIRVQSLGRADPPEEKKATHFSIFAWSIPWTEEPGGLQSMGSQRVRDDWSDLACMFKYSLITWLKNTAMAQQRLISNWPTLMGILWGFLFRKGKGLVKMQGGCTEGLQRSSVRPFLSSLESNQNGAGLRTHGIFRDRFVWFQVTFSVYFLPVLPWVERSPSSTSTSHSMAAEH